MAGRNASEIRIAGTGRLYVADVDTDLPAFGTGEAETDWAEWKDLGYTTSDGVTFGKKDKLEPIDAWQAVSPVHFVYSDRELTLKFSLLQFNEDTLPFFMGGGTVKPVAGSTDVFTYDLADYAQADPRALALEFNDIKADGSADGVNTAVTYRIYIPRGQVTASDDIKLGRKAAAQLGITFTAMSSGDDQPLAKFLMQDGSYAATA
ncbi:phage tail protein [Streptomyces sp. NPDC126497]|uniref:phage tail tube protein n=1 Tax=Streptomyces sp. NPDC126497 TaxID=3155313 RepID=UPI0033328FDD